MTEGTNPPPGELGLPHELQFGQEFFPFATVHLPEIVQPYMIGRRRWTEDIIPALGEGLEAHPPLGQVKFKIAGVEGEIILYGIEEHEMEGSEQALENVHKVMVSTHPNNGEVELEMKEVPLGFSVQIKAPSLADVYMTQRTKLQLLIGDKTCNLFLGKAEDDLFEGGSDSFEDIRTFILKAIEQQRVYHMQADSNHLVNGEDTTIDVPLPYDEDMLKTIRASFHNDVIPAFPPTDFTYKNPQS